MICPHVVFSLALDERWWQRLEVCQPSALCLNLHFKFVRTVEPAAWTGRGLHHMQQSRMLGQAFSLCLALSCFSFSECLLLYRELPA